MGRYARFRAWVFSRAGWLWRPTPATGSPSGIRAENYAEEHYPQEPLLGAAPNFGHDTDSYSSDWAHFVDLWTRSLAVSLGGRLMRADITVDGGHKHDDYRTDIEWREFCRVRILGDNQGTSGPDDSKGLAYITSDTALEVFSMMTHLDDQWNSADLFVRVAQPAPGATTPDGWLEISAELIDLNDDVTVVVANLSKMAIESKAGGVQFPNRWLGPVQVPLAGLTIVRGQYWICIRIYARVLAAGTIGGVFEAKLGKVRR